MLENWLAFVFMLAAIGLGAVTLLRRYLDGVWSWSLYLPAAILGSYGVGGMCELPWWADLLLIAIPVGVFLLLLVLVVVSGVWSAPLAHGITCTFFFGLGAATCEALQSGLREAIHFLISIRVQEPWWLLLLLLIPALVYTSFRELISLGAYRRWIVLGLRSALIVFLAFALAEVFARKPNENVTVIFLWDRSLSMPPELQQGRDLREERIYRFINQSVAERGTQHANDRVGVIVFGKQPRLELPPHAVPKLGFKKILSQLDSSYTDVGSALKLALASFPEGSAKRIVLISDGNENMGRAEEEARIARQNGVEIDVVPIAAGRSHKNEILVERIEAPPITEKDSRLPLRVVVRSFHPQVVVAQLNLRKINFEPGKEGKDDKHTVTVKLHQGLNVYYFQQAGSKEDTVFAYEATVVPLRVETPGGALVSKDLPGDRVDNNVARVCVMARGERAILLLEPREDGQENSVTHQLLVDWLRKTKSSLKVAAMSPDQLRRITKGDNERLATFLGKFDAVILANVPAEMIPPEEQQVIRSHVHDQGAGLIMIGGNQSFGAGGWQNTEIEKALPVNMELKSMKVDGKSGLVLIMHASEIAEGNAWQRKIAKLALEKLSPMDMVGQIHYDHGFAGGAPGHRYHIPFQEIGGNRQRLLRLVDTMEPGDMPDVDPAFQLAHKELTNKEYGLGTKHIILISDGDHWAASQGWLNRLKASNITCTTVCITSHGQAEVRMMAAVAQSTGGRAYHIKDANELPAIYIKETRLVSQSFVHEKPFDPILVGREGPTEGMHGALPQLHGFVRTTKKDSSLVKLLIETPLLGGEHKYRFPILATWQYGLGKSVAFTSDARTTAGGKPYWDRDWANADLYAKFWDQTIAWALRPTETGKHLFLSTEHKDGKIKITVEAQDVDKTPLTDVKLKAGITSPGFKVKDDKKFELKFEQKNAGVYEAVIPADEVGAYFINIRAEWDKLERDKNGNVVKTPMTDNVRAGVTIPYSPEFAEMESNPGLLEKLSEMTGGKIYRDDSAALDKAALASDVFRPVPESHATLQAFWPWLVFLTALCLLLDVAVRRIAIQPDVMWTKAVTVWQRLRGQAVTEEKMPEYIERLKSRKASVGETMDKKKAAKKFEKAEGTTAPAAPTVEPLAPPAVEKPKPPPAKPKAQEEEGDFASRLMRAKKKAMEERDKDKPK